MKKLLPYIAFAYLTGLTAISGIPVFAGGCSSKINKTAEIKCTEDDIECQTEKAKKFDLSKPLNS